jgi:hypothetical protein
MSLDHGSFVRRYGPAIAGPSRYRRRKFAAGEVDVLSTQLREFPHQMQRRSNRTLPTRVRWQLRVMCGRRLIDKSFFTLMQHWSGAVMCPAC